MEEKLEPWEKLNQIRKSIKSQIDELLDKEQELLKELVAFRKIADAQRLLECLCKRSVLQEIFDKSKKNWEKENKNTTIQNQHN